MIDDDEGNGDPHFIVTSHDQYHTKMCYDVNGEDGDVLLIIRDEENGKHIYTMVGVSNVALAQKLIAVLIPNINHVTPLSRT